MRGGKTPCKRKIAFKAIFQEHWGGIGGDRVQSKIYDFCERHSRPRAWRFFRHAQCVLYPHYLRVKVIIRIISVLTPHIRFFTVKYLL